MNSVTLRIFSDRKYVPKGTDHVIMLYPFWGKNFEDSRDPSSGRFDRYSETGKDIFRLCTLEDSDVVVLPVDWDLARKRDDVGRLSKELLALARGAKKGTVLFFWNDSEEEILEPGTVVFRTSFYRSRRKNNEFAMPAWSEDIVARYAGNSLPIRPKSKKPVVGFCGYVPRRTLRRAVKRIVRSLAGRRPSDATIRQTALRYLDESPLVETNFIHRDQFLGGSLRPGGEVDYEALQRSRHEFVQNTFESDYVLCTRGAGNFSYRLYEVLSAGRIPVFLDTDCVLPYDFAIDWKDYCVWVNEREAYAVAKKVAQFHESLSESAFRELQRKCRQLWVEHLSPEGYFRNFYKHFR